MQGLRDSVIVMIHDRLFKFLSDSVWSRGRVLGTRREVAGKLTFSKKVGNIDILIFLDRYYFALFFNTHVRVLNFWRDTFPNFCV